MTSDPLTSDQDRAVEAIANEYGAAHVIPYCTDDDDRVLPRCILVCGWEDDHRVGPWMMVWPAGAVVAAHRSEVAYALEAADRRTARLAGASA